MVSPTILFSPDLPLMSRSQLAVVEVVISSTDNAVLSRSVEDGIELTSSTGDDDTAASIASGDTKILKTLN